MTAQDMVYRLSALDRPTVDKRRRMSDAQLASLLEMLIEAERCEARSIQPFLDGTSAGIRSRLVQLQRVGSRNIAALTCLLRRFGAEPRDSRAPFPAASLTRRSFGPRLELLQRGQAWVARTIERALPHIGDGGVRDQLGVVRESHLLNVGVCRAILADLGYDRFAPR